MDQLQNKIAIELTKKIEHDLLNLVSRHIKIKEDEIPTWPGYYEIRNSIVETMQKYVRTFSQMYQYSPMEIERMRDNEGYWQHVQKTLACSLGEAIFEAKAYNKEEFVRDQFYGSKYFNVAIIDYSKLLETTSAETGEKP